MFSLNLSNAYAQLEDTKVTNDEVEALVAKIVDRVVCVIVTVAVVPVISDQRCGPVQLVAPMLDAFLREHLQASNNALGGCVTFAAPSADRLLLVTVDRALELPVMTHHMWKYQSLNDVLGMRLTSVTVSTREGDGGADRGGCSGERRTVHLDEGDAFWWEHAGVPFRTVAEAVDGALQSYHKEVADLKRSAGALGDDRMPGAANETEANGDGGDTAGKLAVAVSHITELAKKNHFIEVHANIALTILENIKERGLDGYFQVEEELLVRPRSFHVERVLTCLPPTTASPITISRRRWHAMTTAQVCRGMRRTKGETA